MTLDLNTPAFEFDLGDSLFCPVRANPLIQAGSPIVKMGDPMF